MGQSISVKLYGCRIPEGTDIEDLRERWEEHVEPKVKAFEARLDHTVYALPLAEQAYLPQMPHL